MGTIWIYINAGEEIPVKGNVSNNENFDGRICIKSDVRYVEPRLVEILSVHNDNLSKLINNLEK